MERPKSRIDNRWSDGDVHLVFPLLEQRSIGATGASFQEVAFKPGYEPELFLCILEESQWARQYGAVRELGLFASILAVNTDLGPVAMVIWRLANGDETLVHYEHHLCPLHEPTRRLLRRIETQSRLKLVMRDNISGETRGFWEFDNNFAMGE